MINIEKYQDQRGRCPFDEWLEKLKDHKARQRIIARVRRLALGLEGDWKAVGGGVRELRIPEGKGYRVYYGWRDETLVVLLCGGNKQTQQQDIAKAKQYWSEA